MTLLVESMLPIMYWGDDEEQKKKRVAEDLRRKKAKRKGELVEANIVTDEGSSSEEVAKQQVLLAEQGHEISELKHLLIKQSKQLEKILEQQSAPRYEVIHKPSAEEVRLKEPDPSLPTLGELDVKVIKTDNIEAQGEAGEVTKQGQSVKDRVAKLRELKKRGKK